MRRIGLAVILAVGFVLAPLAVNAQPADRVYRIGMLERTSPAINAANLEGFRHGLRTLGYTEGKNFVIEYRSADGRDERFPGLAAERARGQRLEIHNALRVTDATAPLGAMIHSAQRFA